MKKTYIDPPKLFVYHLKVEGLLGTITSTEKEGTKPDPDVDIPGMGENDQEPD